MTEKTNLEMRKYKQSHDLDIESIATNMKTMITVRAVRGLPMKAMAHTQIHSSSERTYLILGGSKTYHKIMIALLSNFLPVSIHLD